MGIDYYEAMQQQAEEEFWENLPKELHESSVQNYLGGYGDAIDTRIDSLAKMAQSLLDKGFYGPSLTVSAAAIEVMIQYFCIRPLVEGAFLSEVWAVELSRWIVDARPSDQRKILIGLLKLWDIELETILLEGKEPLWGTIHSVVLIKRHKFVHRGDEVSKAEAILGIKCCLSFRSEVIGRIASRLGFTLDQTGCWAKVVRKSTEPGHLTGETRYSKGNPFQVEILTQAKDKSHT